MLNAKYKSFFNRLFDPAASLAIRLGLTPNQLTVMGLVLGVGTCFLYLRTGNLVLFASLIFATSLFDALDGVVARRTGKITKFGAYLDAMCDRIFEGAVAITVAVVTQEWILISVVLLGAFCISYAKARAAIEVPVSNTEWPDLMERAERDLIFITGFFLSEYFGWRWQGQRFFYWVLVVLNAAVYLTVLQRILRAKRLIEERA